MRGASWWLALAVAGAGCGTVKTRSDGGGGGGDGAEEGLVDFQSGARLKARVLDGGGGARAFLGWVDSELDGGAGLPCQFLLLADGSWRCLPEAASVGYLDPECQQPIGLRGECQSAEAKGVAVLRTTAACEPNPHVTAYTLGAPLGGEPAAIYVIDELGRCAPSELAPGLSLFQLEGPIDPDTYVSATYEQVARDARLAVDVRVGDDGSREVIGSYDLDRGVPCAEGIPEPPSPLRCLPAADLAYLVPEAARFEDATCETEVAYRPRRETICTPPTLVTEFVGPTPDGCAYELAFADVGEQVDLVYGGAPGRCEEVPPDTDGNDYYRIGEAVPATAFAELRTAEIGTAALAFVATTTVDGERVFTSGARWKDTGGDRDCLPQKFGDGTTRCVPTGTILHTIGADKQLFADASCTQRIERAPADPCNPQPRHVIDGNLAPGCGLFIADAEGVRPVTRVLAAAEPSYQMGGGAGCLVEPRDLATEWLVTGDPVAPTEFPLLTERVDD